MESTPALPAIETRKITDTTYDILRASIVNSTFAPGQRLQVDELAQQLRVSATPVKSALGRLAQEGLVRISPRRGTYVTDLPLEEVMETYDIRRALEVASAETVISRIGDQEIRQLEDSAEALADAVRAGCTIEEHVNLNFAFHELLVHLSGNRRMLEMYKSLNAPIKTARIHYSQSSDWRTRVATEGNEHAAILAALRSRDLPGLTQAIQTHIDRAKSSLRTDMLAATASEPSQAKGGESA